MSAAMAASELYTKVKPTTTTACMFVCDTRLPAGSMSATGEPASRRFSSVSCYQCCHLFEKTNGCGGVGLGMAQSPGNSTFKLVFVAKKMM